MQQRLPLDGFKWLGEENLSVDNILLMLEDLDENSEIGCVLEVDVLYPQNLHDSHNDFPYLSEKGIPPNGKFPKLMVTLNLKNNYVVHYMILKQALEAGLVLKKVHRVINFRQTTWLADYINLNTDMRKNATNEFKKNFFKLMNNAVFGMLLFILLSLLLLILFIIYR
jgi:hypothetical protein